MKVILIKDVAKVGRMYEIKEVANGYASNFLIARGLALPATPATIRRLEHKKAQKLGNHLAIPADTRIILKAKANEAGHLFAKIHETEISEALKKQANLEISATSIILEQAIKELGEFIVKVKTGQVAGQFTLLVERLSS